MRPLHQKSYGARTAPGQRQEKSNGKIVFRHRTVPGEVNVQLKNLWRRTVFCRVNEGKVTSTPPHEVCFSFFIIIFPFSSEYFFRHTYAYDYAV